MLLPQILPPGNSQGRNGSERDGTGIGVGVGVGSRSEIEK